MTIYVFKINGKSVKIIKKIGGRKPKKPDENREHIESSIYKWHLLDNPNCQQKISMRALSLQIKAGHMSNRVACGYGRYKVTIYLQYLKQGL